MQRNVFTKTGDHDESFKNLEADLTRGADLTLRLAKASLQYVILCDAMFQGAALCY